MVNFDKSKIAHPTYIGLDITTLVLYFSIIYKPSKYFAVLKFNIENCLIAILGSVVNLKSILFFTFSIVLPNTELFINLKKSFSKSFLAFFLKSLLPKI